MCVSVCESVSILMGVSSSVVSVCRALVRLCASSLGDHGCACVCVCVCSLALGVSSLVCVCVSVYLALGCV